MTILRTGFASAAALAAFLVTARAEPLTPQQQLAREIYQELIEINTVTATPQSAGDTLRAAEAMAARLRTAGYGDEDIHVLSPAPRRANLVARLRGTGEQKPILLVAHIDTVEARREDWSTDPFKLIEKDGYFYARGSIDQKYLASTYINTLIRYKREGFKPNRDIIVLLETDEEIGDRNKYGIRWMLENHRALIDAEFAFNEGAYVGLRDGVPVYNSVQIAEKVAINFEVEVTDKGGHSSLPTSANPIHRLSEALVRLSKFSFPLNMNETTQTFFSRMAEYETPQIAEDIRGALSKNPDIASRSFTRLANNPVYNSRVRTTCTTTQITGGHAANALPQLARATVNCRVMPGEPIEDIQATLVRVIADDTVKLTLTSGRSPSPASMLGGKLLAAIEKVTGEIYPGIPIIPIMAASATDSSYLRAAGIPAYGHTGLGTDMYDKRSHGKDERVLVSAYFKGQEYVYRLVKTLSE